MDRTGKPHQKGQDHMTAKEYSVVACAGDTLGHTTVNVLVEPTGVSIAAAGDDRFDSVILTVDELDCIRTAMAQLEGVR
jgi:hypothetical protein